MHTSMQRGFTLIEMLVVIIIIGILAAILVPTVGMALRKAKNTAIAMEMNQLSSAIEAYKLERKDYPPDFSNQDAIVSHLRSAFPRSKFRVNTWMSGSTVVPWPSVTPDPRTLDAAEALVFWLSRTKNNPRNPISGQGDFQVFYEFKSEQLTDLDGDGWQEYVPLQAKGAPFVYFDGRLHRTDATPNYAYGWAVYPSPFSVGSPPPAGMVQANASPPPGSSPGVGVVRPYRTNNGIPTGDTKTWPADTTFNNTLWVNPGTYQIHCAGLDNHFGYDNVGAAAPSVVYKKFPTPNYYIDATIETGEDKDNLPGFSEGKTIADSIP